MPYFVHAYAHVPEWWRTESSLEACCSLQAPKVRWWPLLRFTCKTASARGDQLDDSALTSAQEAEQAAGTGGVRT